MRDTTGAQPARKGRRGLLQRLLDQAQGVNNFRPALAALEPEKRYNGHAFSRPAPQVATPGAAAPLQKTSPAAIAAELVSVREFQKLVHSSSVPVFLRGVASAALAVTVGAAALAFAFDFAPNVGRVTFFARSGPRRSALL